MTDDQKKLHNQTMKALQYEWDSNHNTHIAQRFTGEGEGIRSSQISATIALLIQLGVITEVNLQAVKHSGDEQQD